jgi:hypothetical protein
MTWCSGTRITNAAGSLDSRTHKRREIEHKQWESCCSAASALTYLLLRRKRQRGEQAETVRLLHPNR